MDLQFFGGSALAATWKAGKKQNQRSADREFRSAKWKAEHALRERRVLLQEQKFESQQKDREAARVFRFAKKRRFFALSGEIVIARRWARTAI
jgi:hypothetical protein